MSSEESSGNRVRRARFSRATRSVPSSAASLVSLSPDALISACLEHRAGAWDEFLHRYGNLVYSTILKVGLPEADQEEAFQNAIIAIYRQLGRLRDPAKLLSWIIGISHRQAINQIRARRRETLVEEVTDDMVAEDAGGGALPDQPRLDLERAQQARETMEQLNERCRRLLELLFMSEPALDYIEIAELLGIPIGSIGPTRARCLEKARRVFSDRGWLE